MVPMLKQARQLDTDCRRLGLEAIERPPDRPDFHALFRDCHAFARGVGNPERVTSLARSLARFAGFKCSTTENATAFPSGDDNAGKYKAGKVYDRAGLLQEEAVWQGAAGAFVSRCRADYSEAYVDVVTGICAAVEVTRVGLRLLASACADGDVDRNAPCVHEQIATVSQPARLQGLLLCFPYTCSEGSTSVKGDVSDGLCDALGLALGPDALGGVDSVEGRDAPGGATGVQHLTVLQVRHRVSFFMKWHTVCPCTWKWHTVLPVYLLHHVQQSFGLLVSLVPL